MATNGFGLAVSSDMMKHFVFFAIFLFVVHGPAVTPHLNCRQALGPQTESSQREEFKKAARFLIKGEGPLQLSGTRMEKVADFLRYYGALPKNAISQVLGLGLGLAQVADLMRFRPLGANMIPPDHPWVTGINPATGEPIWSQNVLYATETKFPQLDDLKMLSAVGHFMTRMVAKSVVTPELPLGPLRRMPHVVNYIHGTSQYNSAIMIFNNLKEGFEHFSDPKFRAELKRFQRDQHREILLYFRDKDYDLQEYALFITYIRSVLPWFANSDGPKKTVLWGNPAPYPVVNVLTGDWARDLYRMKDPAAISQLAKPPIQREGYFTEDNYEGVRSGGSRWPERLLALYSYYRIQSRGAKGNHSTFDRRQVDKPGSDNYKIAPIYRQDLEDPDLQR
jgi:hypothetical protein